MNSFKIKSYAKINLALNVTGKKAKLHNIESLISFIDLPLMSNALIKAAVVMIAVPCWSS